MFTPAPVQGEADHPPHLEPSQLGTKEYWESFYDDSLSHLSSTRRRRTKHKGCNTEEDIVGESSKAETENYDSDGDGDGDDGGSNHDDDDPGTSWFTEHNAPEKVMKFLTSECFPLAPCNTQSQPIILDLGTGNGSMLALLRDEGGFEASRMVGVDYSPKSIELARRLHDGSTTTAQSSDLSRIRFEVWDVFDNRPVQTLDWFPAAEGGFDIVLDKGTFDAISLSAEEIADIHTAGNVAAQNGDNSIKGSRVLQRRICERYPGIVRELVRKDGFLVITSCNWTEEELIRWFTREEGEDRLVVWDRVAYQKFRFGGKEGQGVCTVCFKKLSGSSK
ncbi:uncharacterized protein PADG_01471 [Paracoccidioides brasiliensis Pb18]|uniref:Protein-lysine N-methyltransferase EFM4 n=1 Tax=Paracoccidioides brasiliensis (strain Pb18) TaxID=502780 RepID=C1G3F5_PARBD|nr:uncharacterized protein PADG_01471 [Paracoccidioides brasiliensis Pb18]EEH45321.1 hypothetical protein PADG_01471 [Paracoccidioides brasiliensis Pb18]